MFQTHQGASESCGDILSSSKNLEPVGGQAQLVAEDEAADGADAAQKPAAKPAQYYTYTPAETSEESCDE